MNARLAVVALAGALFGLPGCIIVTDDEDTGGLSVEWSIEGDTSAFDCDLVGARRMEVVIFDRFDDLVVELQPRCSDFGVGIDLVPGRYVAEVTLVDGFDRAVSYTFVERVQVIARRELTVGLDFTLDDLL